MQASDEVGIQKAYYARTAERYDDLHLAEDEHNIALRYISALVTEFELESILDVGAGTGRGVAHMQKKHPDIRVVGIEPVIELIQEGISNHGLGDRHLIVGSGDEIPFGDNEFDAVCELSVLHHVRAPSAVIAEMTRVARKAVFLSDNNRFGHGPMIGRVAKLLLYKMRLWPAINWIKTRGRGYRISEGDGLSYSYSGYDSVRQLNGWADRIIIVPLTGSNFSRFSGPLLESRSILVCALRDCA